LNVRLQIGNCTPRGTCNRVWEPLAYRQTLFQRKCCSLCYSS